MIYEPTSFREKLDLFTDLWSPRVIAEVNDYQFKLVKIHGDFVWHKHDDTDEAFIVVGGKMEIEFRDGSVELSAGEMFVVPKGVEHRPRATHECHLLIVEPRGVVNTGDTGSDRTVENDVWV